MTRPELPSRKTDCPPASAASAPGAAIRIAWTCTLLLVAGLGSFVALAQSGGNALEIRNGTMAGGGGDIAAAQYQLTGSFGEAVAGTVAAEGFELTAGFPATLNPPNQIIFIDGFEPLDDQP